MTGSSSVSSEIGQVGIVVLHRRKELWIPLVGSSRVIVLVVESPRSSARGKQLLADFSPSFAPSGYVGTPRLEQEILGYLPWYGVPYSSVARPQETMRQFDVEVLTPVVVLPPAAATNQRCP